MIDRQERVYCFRTAMRILINAGEHFDKDEKDFEVGCSCKTEEFANLLTESLKNFLNTFDFEGEIEQRVENEKHIVCIKRKPTPEIEYKNEIIDGKEVDVICIKSD